MRGFGANQAAFAVENLLNRLAKQVGIDAWEIRWRNALQQGDPLRDRTTAGQTVRAEEDPCWR